MDLVDTGIDVSSWFKVYFLYNKTMFCVFLLAE